jgi:hypothetical protein
MINFIPPTYAAGSEQVVDIGKNVTGFFGYTCIGNLVSNAVSLAFIVAAIAFFLILVVGGLKWLTSGGDKAKTQIAQTEITNAVIGLAIVAASYAIYTLVLEFFGIDLSKLCTDNPLGS